MYEQIAANRRNTVIIFAIAFVLLGGLGFVIGEVLYPGAGLFGLGVCLVVALIWSLISLLSGDRIVLRISNAHEVGPAEEPMLWNVVEEMAIAAGAPMPRVYVIEEPEIGRAHV